MENPIIYVLLGALGCGAIFGLVGVIYYIINYLREFSSDSGSDRDEFGVTVVELSGYGSYHAGALLRNVSVLVLALGGLLVYAIPYFMGVKNEALAQAGAIIFLLSMVVSIVLYMKKGGHKIVNFVKMQRKEYLDPDYETTVEYEKYEDEPDSAWRETSRTTVDKNANQNLITFIFNAIKVIIGAVFFFGAATVHYVLQLLAAIYLLFIRKPFLRAKLKRVYKRMLLAEVEKDGFYYPISEIEKDDPKAAKLIRSLHKVWEKKSQETVFGESALGGLLAFEYQGTLVAVEGQRRVNSSFEGDSNDAIYFDTKDGRIFLNAAVKTKTINRIAMYSYTPPAEFFDEMDLEVLHNIMTVEWGYLRLATGAWEPDTEVKYLVFDRENSVVRSMSARIGDVVVQENGVYRAEPATEIASVKITFPDEEEEVSTGITSAEAKVVTEEEEATRESDNETSVTEEASDREDSVFEETPEDMEKSAE